MTATTEEKNESKQEVKEASVAILVMDDEQGIRDLLSFELGNRGYEVVTAGDGNEGIAKMKERDFDVVVSDVKMPNLGGLEALQEMRKIDPKIEVIMSTGFGTIDMAVESIQKGAYDFITKPYNLEDLLSKVRKAVEKRKLTSEITSLKELNRMKSEFLANMSHELRTPMNAIIGYTSLMQDNLYGPLTQKQEQGLKRIHANAAGLLQLINDILDISKLSAGKMPLYIEECSLNEIAAEVVDLMEALAKDKNISLYLEKSPEFKLGSDKTRLKQILINLIGNAIKFTKEGGVALKIEACRLNGTSNGDGAEGIKLSVRDSGIGMRPESLRFIFEEFRQADASTTREFGGTGLGLAIVKKLVELLGGEITVESAVGKGSTFSINLPLKAGVKSQTGDADFRGPEPSEVSASKKTILAIDDDPEVLRILKDSLTDTEFGIVGALGGDEGISLAKQLKPFAITLDILMPHRDGWSVLQALKSDPDTRGIPVIIVSLMENKALGYSLGVADYLIKPFDRKELIERLEQLSAIRGKKILVVDDDEEINRLMETLLKNDGFQVFSAFDGEDAIRMINAEKPDVILLDLMMPKVNGFDVLEAIQANPALNDVQVLIMTAKTLTQQEIDVLKKRAETIIQKGSQNIKDVLAIVRKRLAQMKAAAG